MVCHKSLRKNCSTKYVKFKVDSWNPYSDNNFLTLVNKSLFLTRRLEISPVLLFSKMSWTSQMMETFSNKHKLQRFELHWYGKVFLWIFHDRLLYRPWSFKCFHNSVSFMHSRCLKDFLWLLYRVLNSPSEIRQ